MWSVKRIRPLIACDESSIVVFRSVQSLLRLGRIPVFGGIEGVDERMNLLSSCVRVLLQSISADFVSVGSSVIYRVRQYISRSLLTGEYTR